MRSSSLKKNALIGLFLGVVACEQARPDQAESKQIIGKDDRQEAKTDRAATKAVGYLAPFSKLVVSCNAYINSPGTIRTAKHCLEFEDGQTEIRNLSFVTSEKTYMVKSVAQVWNEADILELTIEPKSAVYLKDGKLTLDSTIEVLSYSPELKLLTNSTESFSETGDGTFAHKLDTVPTSSGSVIFQNGNAVGVHIGALYSDNTKKVIIDNIASKTHQLGYSNVDYHTLSSTILLEGCPEDQHNQCLVPRPRGCAVKVCVPNVIPQMPVAPEEVADSLRNVADDIARPIAATVTPETADKAEKHGWTTDSCTTAGAGLILLPAALYIAPACASSSFITAGFAVAVCVTTVSTAVVKLVCTQLCNDHHLQNCK